MLIREAKNEDARDIRDLVLSLSHFYLEIDHQSLPDWFKNTLTIDEFEKRISRNNDFRNFVTEIDQEISAYLSIKNENHIFHLFVSEKHQNQGLATALWEHVKAITEQDKYTVRSSPFAIPVYECFGFKKTEALLSKDGLSFQAMEWIV